MSAFGNTDQIFRNVAASSLTRHLLESRTVDRFMKATVPLFRMLDHADPAQAEIGRRLWVIRSSVIFTPLRFSDPMLRLGQQMSELKESAVGMPDARPALAALDAATDALLAEDMNPKRAWLKASLAAQGQQGTTGIFHALCGGRAPGWPVEALEELVQSCGNLKPVRSKSDLRSMVFANLIIPCACRNAPAGLLAEAVHSGRTAGIDVLLYPGESFSLPRRLTVPAGGGFKGKIQKAVWDCSDETVPDDSAQDPIETWMNDAFWRGLHQAERTGAPHLMPARYALFADGTGAFLPETGRIPILPEHAAGAGADELCLENIGSIGEGDLIVLKAGDTDFMLDQASEQIMHDLHADNLEEMATDWKPALEALLLTHTQYEIAQDLAARGAETGPANIPKWAGPEILGPGSEQIFRELLLLLARKGKLALADGALASYIDARWAALQMLRGVRMKAGNAIRQNLMKELSSRLSDGTGAFGDRTSIHLGDASSVELLVMRVARIDPTPAFVPASRLCRIDDVRSSKWLG